LTALLELNFNIRVYVLVYCHLRDQEEAHKHRLYALQMNMNTANSPDQY